MIPLWFWVRQHHGTTVTDPWCADTARANLGSCTRGGLAVTSLFLCSTFSFLRCLNIHAWHSPRLELWSCSPCCFLINNEPHMWSYCSHLCCPFCLILYWPIGARQLKWKVAECSPRCSSAFEVLVVVVCWSQPRGYDWHRFYVSSLSFSNKVGLCASCFESRDILWEVQRSRALLAADRLHSSAKWQNWFSYFSERWFNHQPVEFPGELCHENPKEIRTNANLQELRPFPGRGRSQGGCQAQQEGIFHWKIV